MSNYIEERAKEFRCPDYKSNYYALCDDFNCQLFNKCEERRKKRFIAACGCGGKKTCICGFYYEFCVDYYYTPINCPFCGRPITITKYHSAMESIWLISNQS